MKGTSAKTIIFAQYRDQVCLIEKRLQEAGIPAKIFLGRKGEYTKKQQEETISQFRADQFRVLVASSIGEEGLDIPAVDMVVFYEPTPAKSAPYSGEGAQAGSGAGRSIY